MEKFHAWCDCQGDVESIFTKDELLTNIMLYWVTETATSAGVPDSYVLGPYTYNV